MNLNCTILLNEKAGALHAKVSVDHVRDICQKEGLDAEVVTADSEDASRETIKSLVESGVKLIAVAGGDGTVACAVQQLAHCETALGILPQGTANNFATAQHLPVDLTEAIRVLKSGKLRPIDLGHLRGRYFTESAGIGLFADVLAIYGPNSNKNLFRSLYAIFRIVFTMRAHRIHLTLDGKVVEERAVFCVVANSFRMAQGMAVAPDAKVTDGVLDVVVFGNLTRQELIPYYRALRARTHLDLPKVRCFKAREVLIEARLNMPVHCDAKVIGRTPVKIEVDPGALKVMAPAVGMSDAAPA